MTTPKGYIYAELDVKDADMLFNEYMPRVEPMLERWGSRFILGGGRQEVIEGSRPARRVVMVEFDSFDKAKEFFYSEEYQSIIKYRLDACESDLYILEGAGRI